MRPTLTLTILALAAASPRALSPAQPLAPGAQAASTAPIATVPARDAWLGVSIGKAEKGVGVTSVKAGSPAELAGLRDGDVLLEFDGFELGEPAELVDLVRSHAVGEAVHLRFARGDRSFERIVTLGAREVTRAEGAVRARSAPAIVPAPEPPARRRGPAPGADQRRGWMGVSLTPADGAVTIQGVQADSPAEAGGLRAGDRVLSFNGHELADLSGLAELMRGQSPGDQVKLRLSREGRQLELLLELGERPSDASRPTNPIAGARGNWQTTLDRLLQGEARLLRSQREEDGRFARDGSRHFQQRWRGPSEDLVELLREHDRGALGELREIAEQFREERLEAFQEFRERLGDIEQERREMLVEWREQVAERSQEAAVRQGRQISRASDAEEMDDLRRQVEELRAHIEQLRREGGAR